MLSMGFILVGISLSSFYISGVMDLESRIKLHNRQFDPTDQPLESWVDNVQDPKVKKISDVTKVAAVLTRDIRESSSHPVISLTTLLHFRTWRKTWSLTPPKSRFSPPCIVTSTFGYYFQASHSEWFVLIAKLLESDLPVSAILVRGATSLILSPGI